MQSDEGFRPFVRLSLRSGVLPLALLCALWAMVALYFVVAVR